MRWGSSSTGSSCGSCSDAFLRKSRQARTTHGATTANAREREEAAVPLGEEPPDEHRGAEDGDDREEREPEPDRPARGASRGRRGGPLPRGGRGRSPRRGRSPLTREEAPRSFGKNERRISAGPQRRGVPNSDGRACVRRWSARAVR